jgi:hypothetical protein
MDASAVSWGAIVAGGAATAAFSLILLMLGTDLGLSSDTNDKDAFITAAKTGQWERENSVRTLA